MMTRRPACRRERPATFELQAGPIAVAVAALTAGPRRRPRPVAPARARSAAAPDPAKNASIAFDHRGRGPGPPVRRFERRDVLGVGKIAELDQHRGKLRRLQHDEARRTLRIVVEPGRAAQIVDQPAREKMGIGARLPPLQVEQDVGDPRIVRRRLALRRVPVGRVLARGDPRRLGVGGPVRDGVDGRSARRRRPRSACRRGSRRTATRWRRGRRRPGRRGRHIGRPRGSSAPCSARSPRAGASARRRRREPASSPPRR